ncbi:hypothetical protein DS65_00450, partial [Mesotoga sp. SC_4PWL113PWK15]
MIQSAANYKVSALFAIDGKIRYEIPKYQREYVWGKREWDNLYDDIYENQDHFLGSMICIDKGVDALDVKPLEIIDGQQRLLTISILYLVVFARLKEGSNMRTDDQRYSKTNLKNLNTIMNLENRLVQKPEDRRTPRVIPSFQNKNYSDYLSLLSENGIIQSTNDRAPFAGNRRIYTAFRYFQSKLKEESEGQVTDFLDRLNSASMVKIEVANHADAFTLFESLNNRGIP